jgi:hypothetical protein
MQGKNCFNFKKVEPELFDALKRLTAECASAYVSPVVAHPHYSAEDPGMSAPGGKQTIY